MSAAPTLPTWFPDGVDAEQASRLSDALIRAAREAGFRRETYAIAVAQMAEAIVGLDASDDIDGEVLRFVGERFRAAADAIDKSTH